MLCKCKQPPTIFNQIEYLKTTKNSDLSVRKLSIIKEIEIDDTKLSSFEPMQSLLPKKKADDNILFTTDMKDTQHFRINKKPISIVGTNIPSIMGGRANYWKESKQRIGLLNPYQSKDRTSVRNKVSFG